MNLREIDTGLIGVSASPCSHGAKLMLPAHCKATCSDPTINWMDTLAVDLIF